MIRMFSEKGGYIVCMNPNEVRRAEAKGFKIVDEPKAVPKKAANRRTKK